LYQVNIFISVYLHSFFVFSLCDILLGDIG